MEKTIQIINQMKSEGLFSSYAIGGGIAALFYIEPIITFDLDVFIILPEPMGDLTPLSGIYEWLEKRGYKPEKEQIIIEGIPVQFIPAYNDLVKDGLLDGIDKNYGQVVTHVLRPEYLVAIMLQAFRPKDKDRILKFLEQADLSRGLLDSILVKHDLKKSFEDFRRQYYGKSS
jgi:hypothetical protein